MAMIWIWFEFTYICNTFLDSGVFPKNIKTATQIVPIYKARDLFYHPLDN